MASKSGKKQVLTGVIGYGGAFNMGMHHLNSMKAHKGLAPCAICDVDPARAEQAKKDFPDLEVYTDVKELLAKSPVELLVVITPHNTHAPLAIQCLNAGRHVITEKPMACTVDECDKMIAAAQKNKRMLSVYHNRHWDANIVGLTKAVKKGLIGDVFRLEAVSAGYGKPKGDWWRSFKEPSGGFMFDWGAHFAEWLLQIMDAPMADISGYLQKRVWDHVTNEDEGVAVIRFKNGSVARLEMSSIAAAGVPHLFRILGTKGAILGAGDTYTVIQIKDGRRTEMTEPYPKGEHHKYYQNIRDHLLKGTDLIITAELGRRVIQILNYTEISHKKGRSVPVKYE
jgi:predicted dehydrogenase